MRVHNNKRPSRRRAVRESVFHKTSRDKPLFKKARLYCKARQADDAQASEDDDLRVVSNGKVSAKAVK